MNVSLHAVTSQMKFSLWSNHHKIKIPLKDEFVCFTFSSTTCVKSECMSGYSSLISSSSVDESVKVLLLNQPLISLDFTMACVSFVLWIISWKMWIFLFRWQKTPVGMIFYYFLYLVLFMRVSNSVCNMKSVWLNNTDKHIGY